MKSNKNDVIIMYEIIDKESHYIWMCDGLKNARKQLRYVRHNLGYPNAYLHAHRVNYDNIPTNRIGVIR